uniref:Uncharacterized protein n=2 Tax=Caenorhabditis japonica TaxID=281687 RepID=A0A8R1DHY5_CAEJA
MFSDFLAMMFIILIFGSESYYKYSTYLFAFHVCRFIFNAISLKTSDIHEKVLKPLLKEVCNMENYSNKTISPRTIVGLLYIIYLTVLFFNFAVSIILLYCYDPYRHRQAPVIIRLGSNMQRGRCAFRYDKTEPFDSAHFSFHRRSPSPPKLSEIFIPLTKYQRLESCDSFSLRPSKHKIRPLSFPPFHPQLIQPL